MAPTDNLFWVSLWSVYDEGWWTLSKPSQAKEARKAYKEGLKDRRKFDEKKGRKENKKGVKARKERMKE